MLRSLQAGRGVAAISVAAFHLSSMIPAKNSLLSRLSVHGNAGVDFFFVLSGFIILFAHEKDISHPEKLKKYYWRRFARLYPNYWLYTAIIVVAIFFGLGDSPMPHNILDWITTLSLVRLTEVRTPLNVAWTLFYEVAFYGFFSVLIFRRTLGIALFCAWAAALIIFGRPEPTNSVVGVWLSPLCLNFMFGMGACWLHSRIGLRTAIGFAVVGAIGVLLAGIFVDRGLGQGFGTLIALSCTALIAGFAAIERFRPLHFGPLSAIGDASFTLYLVHVHLESPLMKILAKTPLLKRLPADLMFIAVLGFTAGASYLLYLFIEKRLLSWLRSAERRAYLTPAIQTEVN